jgi:hypothetical protein
MKLVRSVCLSLVLAIAANAQQPQRVSDMSGISGTIVLYHSGRSSIPLEVFIDKKPIAELGLHKRIVFLVAPGYHELSVKYGSWRPANAFHVTAGQEMYFDVEFDAPWIGIVHSTALSIKQVKGVLDRATKEQTLTEDQLAYIRFRANPTGEDSKP